MIDKTEFRKTQVHYHLTPGDALKQLRELQELSQNDLAKVTGISQSNISAIECGARQLGRERALIFAKALKVHSAVASRFKLNNALK